MTYTYSTTWGSGPSDIRIDVAGHTGPGMHTISFYIDDVLQFENATVTDETVDDAFTAGLQNLKNQIDAVEDAELDAILVPLGFTLAATTADPIADFTATPGAPGSYEIILDWTIDPDTENTVIQQASMSDYSDAYNIYSGALVDPITVTYLASGEQKYYRAKGQQAGLPDSDWVYANAITP